MVTRIISVLALMACLAPARAEDYRTLYKDVGEALHGTTTLTLPPATQILSRFRTAPGGAASTIYAVQASGKGFGVRYGGSAMLYTTGVSCIHWPKNMVSAAQHFEPAIAGRRLGSTTYPWGELWTDLVYTREMAFYGVAGDRTVVVSMVDDQLVVKVPGSPADPASVDGMMLGTDGFAAVSLASDPGSPVEGLCIWNATAHKFRCYDGSTWRDLW